MVTIVRMLAHLSSVFRTLILHRLKVRIIFWLTGREISLFGASTLGTKEAKIANPNYRTAHHTTDLASRPEQ